MARAATGKADYEAYQRPEPEKVLALIDSHGVDAALTRWHWLSRESVLKLAQAGRQMAGTSRRGGKRTTTPAEEDEIVRVTMELGSVHRASRQLGRTHSLIATIFRERGLDIPILSTEERRRARKESLAATKAVRQDSRQLGHTDRLTATIEERRRARQESLAATKARSAE